MESIEHQSAEGGRVTVDRFDPKIQEALNYERKVYRKTGQITARVADKAEVVTTVLNKGGKDQTETVNTAQPGDYIVKNPGGEEYVVVAKKFPQLYEPKEG